MYVIREIADRDWDDICLIFTEGIDGGNATFATAPANCFGEWMEGKNGTQ